jgi:predicted NBD/HSP70 family sugar kinase
MEATTNIDVRLNNRKRLVNLLFMNGELTKQEIVKKLDMSLATVNYLVKELTEKGLLTTGVALDSTGGRKPTCIKPVYAARYSIGVEATSDVIRIVALDLGMYIVAQELHEIPQENTASYWKRVGELIEEFAEKNRILRDTILDVGVTMGIAMQDEKSAERKKQYQEFSFDMDLAKENIGIPVHFRNSTKMAAIAQCWHGETTDNFLYIYLGAKISGAVVFKNEVMDFSGINGEMGCMVMQGQSDSERLDSILSRRKLCKDAGCRNLEELFQKIEDGDTKCRVILDLYLDELAKFLHNMFCVFGWKIILGGNVSPYITEYLPLLENKIRELCAFENVPIEILSVSHLGEYGSAVGAAMLLVDKFLEFAL